MNYIEHLLILISTITGCLSILAFAFVVGMSIGITTSTIAVKICVITTGIKRCKTINKRKKKKHDKIVLLATFKLNSIEVLISKPLTDSTISHNEFILLNNVLKELDDMKEEIKNSNYK